MLIDFETLPPQARIWIYQAERKFSESEINTIKSTLKQFTSHWESHGHPLKCSFKIINEQFIIIGVDESYYKASGCSIDKSVETLREIEEKLSLYLLDKGKVLYTNGNQIASVPFNKLKEAVETNEIKPDTLLFDNTVCTLEEFSKNWTKPAKNSWISKYFNK